MHSSTSALDRDGGADSIRRDSSFYFAVEVPRRAKVGMGNIWDFTLYTEYK